MAKDLVKGVKGRAFNVWTGLDGFMLSSLTCGMEPVFGMLAALLQVLTCSLFRLVSLFYLFDFYRISHRCSLDKAAPRGSGAGNENGAPERKYVPKLLSGNRKATEEPPSMLATEPSASSTGSAASASPLGKLLRRKSGSK